MNKKTLKAAYHLLEALQEISDMSPSELAGFAEMLPSRSLSPRLRDYLGDVLRLRDKDSDRARSRVMDGDLEQFHFDVVMHKLRYAIMHASSPAGASELDWLIRILLTSPVVFPSVKEVDIFLSNMTGIEHETKSTGRDRIVEWYLRYIGSLDRHERDSIYFRITKYLFAQKSSNYREWKEILQSGGGR